MKIKKIYLRNFLSFDEKGTELPFDDIKFIVGPNGSGKSNLIRALQFVGRSLRDNRFIDMQYYSIGARA